MGLRLAFSTVACPEWTMQQVVERATEYGYEGVELRTLGAGSTSLACDPALSDPAKTAKCFEQAGVEPVCLSTSAALHHRDTTAAHQTKGQLTRDLELAAAIGCRLVRVFGYEAETGRDRTAAIERIAANVRPVAERAGALGIELLFENGGSFNNGKEWWWLLNLVNHPMVGMCWNVANAAAAGEQPIVSVPVLNTRIKLAKVKDTKLGQGSGFVPLGEGDVDVEMFVKRLMGIGYDGYVTVEWDRLWLSSLAPAEQYLPDARQRLKSWMDAIDQWVEQGRQTTAKAAKRGSPKPPVTFVARGQ